MMTPAFIEWIRKEFGSAHLQIAASDKQKADALKVHHATTTRRNNGVGPWPNAGIEAAAYEFAGIPTDRLIDTLRKVALWARAKANPVVRCLRTVIHRVALVSCAEDRARADYHAGIITAEQYAEALLAEARENENAALALLAEGGAR